MPLEMGALESSCFPADREYEAIETSLDVHTNTKYNVTQICAAVAGGSGGHRN